MQLIAQLKDLNWVFTLLGYQCSILAAKHTQRSCLSFPITEVDGRAAVRVWDGWNVPSHASPLRADIDLFTYGRTFCST